MDIKDPTQAALDAIGQPPACNKCGHPYTKHWFDHVYADADWDDQGESEHPGDTILRGCHCHQCGCKGYQSVTRTYSAVQLRQAAQDEEQADRVADGRCQVCGTALVETKDGLVCPKCDALIV